MQRSEETQVYETECKEYSTLCNVVFYFAHQHKIRYEIATKAFKEFSAQLDLYCLIVCAASGRKGYPKTYFRVPGISRKMG